MTDELKDMCERQVGQQTVAGADDLTVDQIRASDCDRVSKLDRVRSSRARKLTRSDDVAVLDQHAFGRSGGP